MSFQKKIERAKVGDQVQKLYPYPHALQEIGSYQI